MSRNGSGGYSLPSNSWNPAVNGVTATAADWQALINDVATAIQQSVSADGQTPITGNLAMGGNKLTGLAAGSGTGQSLRYEQLFSQGALTDIASAATTDIGSPLSNFLRVTGTTGITSFGTNYNGPRFLIFAGAVLLTHSATLVLPSAANITTAANDALIAIPISGGWQVVAYQRADGTSLVASVGNTLAAATTTGTSTAYTITPAQAITAYAANISYWVTFHTASGAAPTLQISGVATPPNLVKQDSTGAYVNIAAGDIPTNHRSRVTLISSTQALVEELPPVSQIRPDVRQTVLSGPVDSNGLPNFGGSTGGTTVTATGTLVATASNGFNSSGAVDYVGSIVNPSWTSLSTNGTMYLYLDIAANGTCTTGSTTLEPTYRWGGADVVTNNQFTFNVQEMVGKVGNGTTASQVYRVFVGRVTVSGGVVTAITWFALMGRYQQAWVSTLPAAGVAINANHNIGTVDIIPKLEVQNITGEFGFSTGDTVTEVNGNTGGVAAPISIYRTGYSVGFTVSNTGSMLVLNKTTGANATMTLANWKYRLIATRAW